MKRCPTCNNENADSMRFCLQCGTPLPDAPMIVDLGGGQSGSQSGQSGFGNTMETQVSNRSNFQSGFQQPSSNFQNPSGGFQNPPNFSNLPPQKPKGGKTWMVVGGIAAMLLLIFSAGAAIIGYNVFIKEVGVNKTPTPTASATPTESPSVSPSKSPTKSPTATPDSTPQKNNSSMRATLSDMWIDYNVTEDGRKGMRIHIDYKAYGMKGVESYLALYFSKKNGDPLYSSNSKYRSADGTLALYKEMNPGYDPAVYEDATLFMPYDEIDLGRGKHNLTISVDVIYKEGGRISHLKDYAFIFTVGE